MLDFYDQIANTSFQNTLSIELFTNPILPVSQPIKNLLLFSFLLYVIGIAGILSNNKNFLITLLAIELMYLGVLMSFILFASNQKDFRAGAYSLLFLILAACESAVGLGILVVLHRFAHSVQFEDFQKLAG
jgi:NADH-quinone oxidoreductase subunit K